MKSFLSQQKNFQKLLHRFMRQGVSFPSLDMKARTVTQRSLLNPFKDISVTCEKTISINLENTENYPPTPLCNQILIRKGSDFLEQYVINLECWLLYLT